MHGDVPKPIACASYTLNQSEREVRPNGKRVPSISMCVCERFTNHKLLVPLMNSSDLNRVRLRCQRLLMQLMLYNPVAEYAPGKTLLVADALSRQPIKKDIEEVYITEEIQLQEHIVRESWPVSEVQLGNVCEASALDDEISDATRLTIEG